MMNKTSPLVFSVGLLGAVLFLVTFLGLSFYHAQEINTDPYRTDQSSYIEHSQQIHREDDHIYFGDRNRMPLYNYILATVSGADADVGDVFDRGKVLNIGLSVLAVVAIVAVVHKFYGFVQYELAAFSFFAGFGSILLKAAYVQAEVLFYSLFFMTFALMYLQFQRKSWRLSLLIGLLSALTYLSKSTMLLTLAIFAGLSAWQMFTHRKNSSQLKTIAFNTVLTLITFTLICSPYFYSNYQKFGTPIYNVNTTFYMWYDSWDEATQGTKAHQDRTGWPNMPEDEIPSAHKYLETHSFGEIAERVVKGIGRQFLNMYYWKSYSAYAFVGLSLLALPVLPKLNEKLSRKKLKWLTADKLFVSAVFSANFLAFAWYTPIAASSRFVLTLYLPALFLILLVYKQQYHFSNQRTKWLIVLVGIFVLLAAAYTLTTTYTGG